MQFIDKLFQHYLNYQVETWNLDSVPFVHSLRQYTHQLLVDILKRTNLKKKKPTVINLIPQQLLHPELPTTSVWFMCVKVLINATYICLLCTCCKVYDLFGSVSVYAGSPHKGFDLVEDVGQKHTKIRGTQETSFGRKGPVVVSPMQFDWLCYMFLCISIGCVTFPENRTVHHLWQTHSTTLSVQVIDINMKQKEADGQKQDHWLLNNVDHSAICWPSRGSGAQLPSHHLSMSSDF